MYSIRQHRSNRRSNTKKNAGDLHWLELEEPIDIVWIVVLD
mgnify:CR=1 FL=1